MKFIYGLLILFMLSGCMTYGAKSLKDTSLYSEIRPGHSQKHDVYEVFGIPSDVKFGGEVWEYAALSTRLSAWTIVSPITVGDVETKMRTVFYFNESGVLIDYKTFDSPKRYRNSWVSLGKALPVVKQCNIEIRESGDRVTAELDSLGLIYTEKQIRRDRFVDCLD